MVQRGVSRHRLARAVEAVFPPHELVQVRGNHGLMDTFHSLELCLNPVPVRLGMLLVAVARL